jgi:hypothetical protein
MMVAESLFVLPCHSPPLRWSNIGLTSVYPRSDP